jgi:hypothetical protein
LNITTVNASAINLLQTATDPNANNSSVVQVTDDVNNTTRIWGTGIQFPDGSVQTVAATSSPAFNGGTITNPLVVQDTAGSYPNNVITLTNDDGTGVTLLTVSDGTSTAQISPSYVAINGVPYATQSWVTSQGYLTSAPVTSVAGRTGAVTLSNTDISGLGTMATQAATSYAALAGATFTGKINAAQSNSTSAGLNLSTGTAPTSPVNGDIWMTPANLVVRLANVSQNIPLAGGTNTWTAGNTFSGTTLTFGNSTATSSVFIGNGATVSGSTKTLNIGTGGLPGSTTNITIGATGATTTFNGTVNATGLANGVKAWVNFNGTGTVAIRASFNVSSITDNGTGDYTLNFTNAMADSNYAVAISNVGASLGDTSRNFVIAGTVSGGANLKNTTQLRLQSGLTNTVTLVDSAELNISILR